MKYDGLIFIYTFTKVMMMKMTRRKKENMVKKIRRKIKRRKRLENGIKKVPCGKRKKVRTNIFLLAQILLLRNYLLPPQIAYPLPSLPSLPPPHRLYFCLNIYRKRNNDSIKCNKVEWD